MAAETITHEDEAPTLDDLRSGTLNRRCLDHRAPGKAVAGAGRKRVAKHLSKHGRRKKS